ncbi:hypothetical protein WBG78_16260 [Chryseolinea sp. T2]|uniref:hypothetical protein n=1 Tax=Chryseolinea sp. T2 TaxID=3129255 RepID=UPI0030774CD0
MGLLRIISELFFGIKFISVAKSFISRDELFQLTFDDNWVYSKKGNSFYSFHNLRDDLKGGLQLSISWNVNPPESMNEKEAVLDFIYTSENEHVDYETVMISDLQAIYYRKENTDSNMTFYKWYIYHEKILLVMTFMIFDGESNKVKDMWIKRLDGIVKSLKLDANKFKTTRMR